MQGDSSVEEKDQQDIDQGNEGESNRSGALAAGSVQLGRVTINRADGGIREVVSESVLKGDGREHGTDVKDLYRYAGASRLGEAITQDALPVSGSDDISESPAEDEEPLSESEDSTDRILPICADSFNSEQAENFYQHLLGFSEGQPMPSNMQDELSRLIVKVLLKKNLLTKESVFEYISNSSESVT